ncbi:MAG TPA: hypothetical protein VHI13_18570 [Candidatus Kapabacteria bacterium]|nr:hypothetical protein [Candidatus Kapabacteria bacterium]
MRASDVSFAVLHGADSWAGYSRENGPLGEQSFLVLLRGRSEFGFMCRNISHAHLFFGWVRLPARNASCARIRSSRIVLPERELLISSIRYPLSAHRARTRKYSAIATAAAPLQQASLQVPVIHALRTGLHQAELRSVRMTDGVEFPADHIEGMYISFEVTPIYAPGLIIHSRPIVSDTEMIARPGLRGACVRCIVVPCVGNCRHIRGRYRALVG